ncbi:MAG TPA: Hpt domain-containing protein [Thermoanaerobaculia bacterium]|nr:Hpt domain-containing protein [Thermoanaerobaculia bacterium]
MSVDDDWAAPLRREYREGLAGKLKNLETLCDSLRANPADAAAPAALATAVHRIKGSAASYGFDEIGAIATEWDLALKQSIARGEGLNADEIAAMEEFLRRFRKAVAQEQAASL